MIKSFIKNIIYYVLKFFYRKKIILFESRPDFSDSPKIILEAILSAKISKKIKIVWFLFDNYENTKKFFVKGVRFQKKQNAFERRLYLLLFDVAICSNRFISGFHKKQKVFYITHGSPFKETGDYYKLPNGIDYVITQSRYMNKLVARGFNIDDNKCYPLGLPRNDLLLRKSSNSFGLFGKSKIIAWYPTVRSFRDGRIFNNVIIPLLNNTSEMTILNSCAESCDVKIVIKIHFAQDVKNLELESYPNIIIVNDDFFSSKGLSSYEFLSHTDALLTDYSSVYYDYLLVDKPIGLIWKDLDEYKKNPGMIPEYDKLALGGEKIYTMDDLLSFIRRVSNGVDTLREERRRIKTIANDDTETSYTDQVLNFILKEGNIK